MVGYLSKARKKLAWLSRILVREGGNVRVSGTFFKAVIQAILIFGSKTWEMIPPMVLTLGVFQHRVAQRIMGKQPPRIQERSW